MGLSLTHLRVCDFVMLSNPIARLNNQILVLLVLLIDFLVFTLHFINEVLTFSLYLAISALQLALALFEPLSNALLGAADTATFLLQDVFEVLSALNVLFKVFFKGRLPSRHLGLTLLPPVHIPLRE